MKRRLTVIFIACMAIAAGGCGDKKENNASPEATEQMPVDGTEEGVSTASIDIAYQVGDYVTLGDYSNLEVTLNEADYQVTEQAVNEYVDQTIAYTNPYQADESKTVIEAGDIVDVNYVGKKDGVAFDGGSAENQIIDVSENKNVTTGTGYIDGFTDGLIGAKVGETVDCEATFPDEYQSEELKGQTVVFSFTINSIGRAIKREDLDDAYVKENFQAESVDDFYANIRKTLEEQAENSKKSALRSAVVQKLTENCKVNSFPEGLVETRLEEYVNSFRDYYCSDGTELEDFLMKNYNVSEEQFREENQTYLETNLTQELILEAIAEKEKIAFDQEGYDAYISDVLTNGGYASKEDLYQSMGSSEESGERYFKKVYLENKACDMLVENATVNYTKAEEDTESAVSTEQ